MQKLRRKREVKSPGGGPGRPVGSVAGTTAKRAEEEAARLAALAATRDPNVPLPRKRGRPPGPQVEREVSNVSLITGEPVRGGRGQLQLRPMHQEEVRAKIQSVALVQRLQDHARGLVDLLPTQVKAIEILLSKSISTLASTEVNMVSNNDKLSEGEIMDKIGELIARNPALIQVLQARQAAGSGEVVEAVQVAPVVEAADTPECALCGDEGMPGGCIGCGYDAAEDDGASDGSVEISDMANLGNPGRVD